ncbi:serpin-ZX [Thalictrum thalictroides]|uniref:Serpin-ZX n=1 Tax=Thalictrum thalictroides TaxID=46969 RepID=A0A7J6UXC3_THATH|nr:serpin-ZX [Thalictrum thalictroides]
MDLQESIRKHTEVSLNLVKHVSLKHAKESNLVFSPLSIDVVLSLIAAGAKGETLYELLKFLKSQTSGDLNSFSSELVALVLADGSKIGGPRMSFANGVWIEKSLPLKPYFKDIVDTIYKASSKQVDFQTKL